MANKERIFDEMWHELRDYYAPTMSLPEAIRTIGKYMTGSGHEVYSCGRGKLKIDGEFFQISKPDGYVHFEIRQIAG